MTTNVLWTGGWDSTFRVLQTAICEGTVVQPHYVIDHKRQSLQCELAAMASIKDALAEKFADVRSRILPTRCYERCEIPPNEAITASHRSLLTESYLGWQYDWLARLAAWQRIPGLELSVHRDDRAHAFIQGIVERNAAGALAVSAARTDAAAILFRDFVFPILDFTKLRMAAIAREHGFSELLELTWFCQSPDKHQRPCGSCGPCRHTITEGLARRVPPANRVKAQIARVYRGVGRRIRPIVPGPRTSA